MLSLSFRRRQRSESYLEPALAIQIGLTAYARPSRRDADIFRWLHNLQHGGANVLGPRIQQPDLRRLLGNHRALNLEGNCEYHNINPITVLATTYARA